MAEAAKATLEVFPASAAELVASGGFKGPVPVKYATTVAPVDAGAPGPLAWPSGLVTSARFWPDAKMPGDAAATVKVTGGLDAPAGNCTNIDAWPTGISTGSCKLICVGLA